MISGDTIAAIATAPGRGGVAVVRVSGPEAFGVARKVADREPQPGRVTFVCLRSPASKVSRLKSEVAEDVRHETLDVIDTGLLLAFKAPHSYTGEDVVEFQCHGGTVTPRRVLEACLAAGARLARRGEFTERAFLNGKLDYNQAESVLDLVDAKTARAADAALEGLAGRRARECRALYEQALDLSTRIEHSLDVDEGELPADFLLTVTSSVFRLKSSLREAIRRSTEGRLLQRGALVVLAGPPNAGKSSLLNALLEENRAIVSDVPGTTRDSIEAWIDLDGWPIRLVDTAGLHETDDALEVEGVRRAEELLSKADLVLWMGTPPFVSRLPSSVLRLHSKCDLGHGEGLNVSAKTGEGLGDLKRAIVAKLEAKVAASDSGDTPGGDVAAYHEAQAILSSPNPQPTTRNSQPDLVLLANAVRGAAERLGAAVGATYSSDMLDNLFSRFCVGK